MSVQERGRPEAKLEAEILLALGRTSDIYLAKNEVGLYYKASVVPALAATLAPFGREVTAAVFAVLKRHRQIVGLGKGSPDLVGAVAGRALGLELKAERGVVSPDQQRYAAAARARGCFVALPIRSVEEAKAAIQRCREGGVE